MVVNIIRKKRTRKAYTTGVQSTKRISYLFVGDNS